jgi:hypothetical protein
MYGLKAVPFRQSEFFSSRISPALRSKTFFWPFLAAEVRLITIGSWLGA